MRKVGVLLVLLSLGTFTLGCGGDTGGGPAPAPPAQEAQPAPEEGAAEGAAGDEHEHAEEGSDSTTEEQ